MTAPSSATQSLHLEQISHRYGASLVVDGVGLSLAVGEPVSLPGPSGCGKTTRAVPCSLPARRMSLPPEAASRSTLAPGLAAGAFVCFMAWFGNIPVSLFLRDAATDMLPIRMWPDLEGKLDVTIAAGSTVLIVLTVALAIIMERIAGLSRRLG